MTTDKITKNPGPLAIALGERFDTFLYELEAQLVEEREAIQVWLGHVKANVKVEVGDSLEAAVSLARLAKARLEALEADRVVYSGPLHKWKGKVDAVFKALTKPLEEVIQVTKGRMGDYGARKAQERALVMQASAAQLQAGTIPTTPIPEPAQAQGVTLKVFWRATVVEPDLVPRDLCSPDLAKIQDRIAYADTAATPPQPIPGLDFTLETQTTIRKA